MKKIFKNFVFYRKMSSVLTFERRWWKKLEKYLSKWRLPDLKLRFWRVGWGRLRNSLTNSLKFHWKLPIFWKLWGKKSACVSFPKLLTPFSRGKKLPIYTKYAVSKWHFFENFVLKYPFFCELWGNRAE